jgi:fluoroacetyl-CoA thioesterase
MGSIVSVVPPRSTGGSGQLDRTLVVGISARVSLTVSEADTAPALRAGSVPVLATPRLIGLCQEAGCRALDNRLHDGQTSVDSRVQFDHLAPVPIGGSVKADATLTRIEGRRLTFTVSVTLAAEDTVVVGAGRLTRVLVDEATFMEKVTTTPKS